LFYAYLIIAPRCQSAHTGIEFTAGEKIFILLFETPLEMFQNCHAHNTSYLESVPALQSNKKQFLVKRFVYFCIFSEKEILGKCSLKYFYFLKFIVGSIKHWTFFMSKSMMYFHFKHATVCICLTSWSSPAKSPQRLLSV